MAYSEADILAAARKIRAHLDELAGAEAGELRSRLDDLIAQAGRDPRTGTRILALLRTYPRAYAWMTAQLDQPVDQPPVRRGGTRSITGLYDTEKSISPEPGTAWAAEPDAAPDDAAPDDAAPDDAAPDDADPAPSPVSRPAPAASYGVTGAPIGSGIGITGGSGHYVPPTQYLPPHSQGQAQPGQEQPGQEQPGQEQPGQEQAEPGQRFFLAELLGRPTGGPLLKETRYTVAFSVGPSLDAAIAQSVFPDELLAAADTNVDVFDLTVQLDSDDFAIFSDRAQRLSVPRTGLSLNKAYFDVAARRDGDCRLTASVHYQGNFVHQMELTIPVGGPRGAQTAGIDVATRGRPPESAATLEPRDISILLEPAPGGGFLCTALGSVGGRAILPISATELATAVDAARSAMMNVIGTVSDGERIFQARIDIPAGERDTALRTLARAGSRLFQQLFLHPAAGADARRVGEWLRGYAMDPLLRLNVQIFADQAPLPWAMLYLGDAAEGAALDWNNFLGMRHIIEQLPLQMSLGTVDNEISSRPRLSVSVNVNTSIDPAMGITLVAGHLRSWRDIAAARTGLSVLSRSTKSEVVRALADGHTGDQVVYFYCHATAGGQNSSPDAAAIIMGVDDAATVADLNIDAPTTVQLPGNPLVFINACESAELSPLFYNGFVPYFMAKGARGVIGTECKTPVLFAIEWADAFFERFLDGGAVGETMLELRRRFLYEHGNPLGLIYATHCDADTRVAPALALATGR